MTQGMDWLQAKVPGFNHLSQDERDAITDFSLLWSLFESRVLNTHGTAQAIREVADQWRGRRAFDTNIVDNELAYFRQRYYADGQFTEAFDHLHLRRSDRKDSVRAVLDGRENDPFICLAAALIIVFRYRNNLFHGIKWQYDLRNQLPNFTAANSILMKVLEQSGNLAET
jgi:hypothetical protein